MEEKLEQIIRAVYKKWKADQPKLSEEHPDEEALACFLEDRLPLEDKDNIVAHIISCDRCADIVAMQIRLQPTETKEVPPELIARLKGLLSTGDKASILEIALRLKEKLLEILNTTGDVLVGQELVPAPVLRSRSIKDFKDEVTILKDFQDIRVEAKIENKAGLAFDLFIVVKEKETQKVIKDLRVTLVKDDLELESYLTDSGSVTFEHILLGKYTVEISTQDGKLASILLDIKT